MGNAKVEKPVITHLLFCNGCGEGFRDDRALLDHRAHRCRAMKRQRAAAYSRSGRDDAEYSRRIADGFKMASEDEN